MNRFQLQLDNQKTLIKLHFIMPANTSAFICFQFAQFLNMIYLEYTQAALRLFCLFIKYKQQ